MKDMSVIRVEVGSLHTNCYILKNPDTRDAIVIDPGADLTVIQDALHRADAVCRLILLTHGHFDHIYGLADLVKTYGIPVYMDKKETYSFEHTNPYVCGNYGLPLADIPEEGAFRYISEGDIIEVGDLHFEVLETPGHSVGGVYAAGESL